MRGCIDASTNQFRAGAGFQAPLQVGIDGENCTSGFEEAGLVTFAWEVRQLGLLRSPGARFYFSAHSIGRLSEYVGDASAQEGLRSTENGTRFSLACAVVRGRWKS